MGAAAGHVRVSDAQWEHIAKQLGLRPLRFEWVALDEEVKALTTGSPPVPRDDLYVNGGMIWMKKPQQFGDSWALHVRKIWELFESHPLRDQNVCGSDMAGLATAIGVCGKFSMLPNTFNYRPSCFYVGGSSADDVKMIHMTNMNMPEIKQAGTIEEVIRLFWERRIFQKIIGLPADMRRERMDNANEMLRRVCALISEYDLNKIVLRQKRDYSFLNPLRGFRKS
jgi:hypothetical protein